MSKRDAYQEIKQLCRFAWSEMTGAAGQRHEYWKHGRIQYTVLLESDNVVRICGCVLN